jgi:hypothetical protein
MTLEDVTTAVHWLEATNRDLDKVHIEMEAVESRGKTWDALKQKEKLLINVMKSQLWLARLSLDQYRVNLEAEYGALDDT